MDNSKLSSNDLMKNKTFYNNQNSAFVSQSRKLFDSNADKNFLGKIRRRSIKNNKIVYINPSSAAARKLAQDMNNNITPKAVEECYELNDNKIDELCEIPNELNFSGESDENNENLGKKPRGSRYRGVSRNGNQWQVLIMVAKKKRYVGSYSNEEEAARAYDKAALQNHGTKAKTNFDYVDEELNMIINEPPILKLNITKTSKEKD